MRLLKRRVNFLQYKHLSVIDTGVKSHVIICRRYLVVGTDVIRNEDEEVEDSNITVEDGGRANCRARYHAT